MRIHPATTIATEVMMRKVYTFALTSLLFLFLTSYSSAHSGRTDSCGGHNDRKHGGYHVHNYSKYCSCYPNSPECNNERARPENKTTTKGFSKGVAPVNEWDCPETHPIKGNINVSKSTRIFHSPGGVYYSRTKPERCYASDEEAVADGFRQSTR